MSNEGYFSLFMDFRESLTLAMLQSGLNTLYAGSERNGVDRVEVETRAGRQRWHELDNCP
jgi:hypothetical protein